MDNFIRIFVVEDQSFWQNMITRELNTVSDFLVVGIAETVEQAIKLGEILDYDFIIIDLQLDQTEEDGFVVYQELKSKKNIQPIFLTNNQKTSTMYQSFLNGGYSYIPKNYLNVLPQTIRYLHDNPVPNIFLKAVQDRIKEYRLLDLSNSERLVFDLLKDGFKPKEISAKLNISLYTVRSHIKNVLKKLELNNYHAALLKLYDPDQIVRLHK